MDDDLDERHAREQRERDREYQGRRRAREDPSRGAGDWHSYPGPSSGRVPEPRMGRHREPSRAPSRNRRRRRSPSDSREADRRPAFGRMERDDSPERQASRRFRRDPASSDDSRTSAEIRDANRRREAFFRASSRERERWAWEDRQAREQRWQERERGWRY